MTKDVEILKRELLKLRRNTEKSEVILSMILELADHDNNSFLIPFDDIVVAINTSLELLRESSI